MSILYTVLLVLHIVCWAAALVVYLRDIRAPRVAPGIAHSIAGALVTGLILVALWEMTDVKDGDPNHVKIGIKLLVALIATVLAFTQQKKPAPNPMAHVVAGLVVVNIVIALVW
ncbi:hypothetical protein D9V41_05935 [Aeromicrobium phragmitis]|uniref:Integral membrane protein n=1 Tax=Aeromicrobium phragmitis TaxID=2478914 RepID=A0A3L8PRZ5_9ACTN|nr:hypothetical protein [Aeromicrobium phragmitis]RLV56732.1 hypothetical protein D9V41_05935 [Aeromicrobium phragmitis]